jgi:hypothetical protein
MKNLITTITVMFSITSIFGQHPLVGTWEMVHVKGIDADGERFYQDTSNAREIKIITPTHYILIAHDVEGDSLIFNRTYAGAVKVEGEKYIETPLYSSLPIFDNVTADFKWKIENERFIQSGLIVRPDGKKIILEELVFKRVKTDQDFQKNPAIGTWNQLSSSFTNTDGTTGSHTNDTHTRFQIITPTHWMRISHHGDDFEHVMGGTYTLKNGKNYSTIEFASFPLPKPLNTELKDEIKEGKLHQRGIQKLNDGKKLTWSDVFERVR